ncbi:hypothetical protein [Paraburkholderia adhaesiva]|uniref:hypothetical protein n=1 Tax=Paraburkholderia adhaesiva TaxID=2883244 RepID=UPI002279D02D|nr:hypothetical protein [Paraburkholderia adhaesiva]
MLKEVETPMKDADVCRNHGISAATFFTNGLSRASPRWRSKAADSDIVQVQVEAKLPVNGPVDDCRPEAMTIVRRLRFFIPLVYRAALAMLTTPSRTQAICNCVQDHPP